MSSVRPMWPAESMNRSQGVSPAARRRHQGVACAMPSRSHRLARHRGVRTLRGRHAVTQRPETSGWARVVGWLFALSMLAVAALFVSELAP